MPHNSYNGLPAATNVEQSIVLAQLLILRDLERRAGRIRADAEKSRTDARRAA